MKMARKTYKDVEEQIDSYLEKVENKDAKKWLIKWVDERRINGKNPIYIRQSLITFLKVIPSLKKPIQKIIDKEDQEEINRMLTSIAVDGKIVRRNKIKLKEFFKWVNDGETPKCVKHISTKKTLDEYQHEKDPLTYEERKAIIENAKTLRCKAIFSIMDECPVRPRGIINLKVEDLKANEWGYELKIRSKTKAGHRTLPLIKSAPFIRLYMASHEYKQYPDSPLFYSYSSRDFKIKQGRRIPEKLDYWGMVYELKYACERAGIKRKINLYDFRKSTATRLLSDPDYTPKEIQKMGGWATIGTMMDVYGKTTDEMVKQKRLIIEAKTNEGLKEKLFKQAQKDKDLQNMMIRSGLMEGKSDDSNGLTVECPRCKTKNVSDMDSCINCWLPLTDKAIMENKDKDQKVVKLMFKMFERIAQKDPELMDELKGIRDEFG